MRIYLGLGSNLSDRRGNLERAIGMLRERGLREVRVSPVVESPALLPPLAPPAWNRPFLNLVVEGEVDVSPTEWLRTTKSIQDTIGRGDASRWAPRLIDIDILLWGDEAHHEEGLRIPHPELGSRAFVISPLVHLRPELRFPGPDRRTVLERSGSLPVHIPLWMGILNVTPDSFSDGGEHTTWPSIEPFVRDMVDGGAHIIDVGAESTRPGAQTVPAVEEWERLRPVLERLRAWRGDNVLGPLLSVDTRHHEVAERAMAMGVDIINDVSGLTSPEMRSLARDSDCTWVAMHNLSVPADRSVTLPEDEDPSAAVEAWLLRQVDEWEKAGLDRQRIIFDPGIGFGKTSLQSLEILRRVERFRAHGLRVLVGHSRKSFMNDFVTHPPGERDVETIGASLMLCQKRVDVLRVHDVPRHVRAYQAWAHLEG